jgi:choline dehydrogenase-like flavoprotein
MGPDPRTSVVGTDGRHHHVANLAVIDGSILPTSLGVNPSLTIYALAARNATVLAERIQGRPFSSQPT